MASEVDIFFQENAWINTKVCLEWTEKTLKKFISYGKLERHVLLLANLEAHIQAEFKEAVNKLSGIVWYGLPNATDLWQPVDAGYAQVLKALIGVEHRDWLDCDNIADRWFCNEEPYTAKERRILITQWASRAWEKLSQPRYDKLRLSCWKKTGCLITNDGSDDDKIKPEGLPNYVVPPPPFLEPSEQNVVDCNIPEERHIEIVKEPIQFGNDTELIENEEERNELDSISEVECEERNLFDFIDELVLEPQ